MTASNGSQRAVCFCAEWRAYFDTLEKKKSPVKLTAYRTSNKYYGTTDNIIIVSQTH